MSANLVIRDGPVPYWWMSPDIWVVPGNNPNAAPNSPKAGKPAYVWARVTNHGTAAADGTRVDFYWADPSAQMTVGTAHKIGSAFADLAPGESQDVLCLVPWIPVVVNNGHECLVAVAHNSGNSNPLPDPLPAGYAFDPPSHLQVAQKNLTVLLLAQAVAQVVLTVTALPRTDKRIRISAEIGGKVSPEVLTSIGLKGLRPGSGSGLSVLLSEKPISTTSRRGDSGRHSEVVISVPRGTSQAVYGVVIPSGLSPEEYELVHFIERTGDRVTGGVSYIVVSEGETIKS